VLAARRGTPPAARYDMYLLKRYALPQLYWHGLRRGRA
jgi:hypothetical protein